MVEWAFGREGTVGLVLIWFKLDRSSLIDFNSVLYLSLIGLISNLLIRTITKSSLSKISLREVLLCFSVVYFWSSRPLPLSILWPPLPFSSRGGFIRAYSIVGSSLPVEVKLYSMCFSCFVFLFFLFWQVGIMLRSPLGAWFCLSTVSWFLTF